MGTRRKGRTAALQVLHQMDVCGISGPAALKLFWATLATDHDTREFTDSLVLGYDAHREAVDTTIRNASKHWRLERMARVDRNIIRLAAYELLHCDDIPRRVTLNEAIELAKRFGDEGSPAFVNGVLDRIAAEVPKD